MCLLLLFQGVYEGFLNVLVDWTGVIIIIFIMPLTASVISGVQNLVLYETRAVSVNISFLKHEESSHGIIQMYSSVDDMQGMG